MLILTKSSIEDIGIDPADYPSSCFRMGSPGIGGSENDKPGKKDGYTQIDKGPFSHNTGIIRLYAVKGAAFF